MSRAPSLCGVILAAGESTRMGTDKALLAWPPVPVGEPPRGTFLSAAIESLARVSEMVIVVGGKNASQIAPFVFATGASLAENQHPERGQFSSLQIGLQEVLNHGRDAAIVTLVDRPPVHAKTVSHLVRAFSSALGGGKWAVVPELNGKHGHPILLSREMIEKFLKAPATSTARDIEHENVEHIEYVPVEDAAVAVNVNTPDEYAALGAATPFVFGL
jgi:molybdenum cofactor cytidylyltransferase